MKVSHNEIVNKSNTIQGPSFPKSIQNELANGNKFCISGGFNSRPLFTMFLKSKGYEVVDRPVKGMKGFVMGEPHEPG